MNPKVKIGIFSALVIVGVSAITSLVVRPHSNIIDKVNRNLSQDQKIMVDNNIQGIQQKLSSLSENNKADAFDLYVQLGHEYYLNGDYAKQRDAFLEAEKIQPNNPDLLFQLFLVYSQMKDNDNAKNALEKSLGISPNRPDVWNTDIAFEKNNLSATNDRIDALYNTAMAKTNNNLQILVPFAQFLETQSNYQAAYEYWKLAVKMDPKNTAYPKEVDRLNKILNPAKVKK